MPGIFGAAAELNVGKRAIPKPIVNHAATRWKVDQIPIAPTNEAALAAGADVREDRRFEPRLEM